MASIEKRDGRKKPYRVHFRDKFSGKLRNKSFAKRKEAQAFLESLGSDGNVIAQSDSRATVEAAMERWYKLSTTTGRNGRPPVEMSTAKPYQLHKNVIIEMIGDKNLAELSKRDCNDLRDKLLERYTRSYAKKYLASFKSALSQAVIDEVIPRSPAVNTRITISQREKMDNRVSIPSLAEIRLIKETIRTLMDDELPQKRDAWARYGPFFYTMLYTGMRPGELRGLAWSSIDWDTNRISVERRADNYNNLGPLKSASSYRTIPVAQTVMDMLMTWQKLCPPSAEDLVFPNRKGNIESLANLTNRGWYVLCKKAGLTIKGDADQHRAKYNLYSLRHAKASMEIALKRSPKRIQTLLGHSEIKMTFDTYGHLFEDESLQDDPNDFDALLQTVAQPLPKNIQLSEIT